MNVFRTSAALRLALAIPFGFVAPACAQRMLVNEAVIEAPPSEVWTAWTTEDGFTSWAVAKAKIDLRVGGEMVTSYVADSTLDDDSTIINRILAFEPERMLSIQNIRAPKAFKNAELFQKCWSVVYFEPLSDERTHVRVVGMGYGESPEWDEIYNKFRVGNEYTLKKLQERFSKGTDGSIQESDSVTAESTTPKIDAHNVIADSDETHVTDAGQVMTVLGKLVGGQWIHQSTTPDGSPFLVRNVLEHGPDDVSIIGRSWLGDDTGMAPHQSTQVFRLSGKPPGSMPSVNFHALDEHGSISSGDIVLVDASTVQWNWHIQRLDGTSASFHVRMMFQDDNHYQMTLAVRDEKGRWPQVLDIRFERVQELPEKFLSVRSSN